MIEPPDNACRFTGRPGHVESYFVRANDPRRPRALWLKQTILSPLEGPAVAETWFIWFDGEQNRTIAQRVTQPWADARFDEPRIVTQAMTLDVSASGGAQGSLEAPEGPVRFDLRWAPSASPIGRPLSIFPYRFLRVGPFPKSKLLTPLPAIDFSGRLELPGETVELERWPGMQGHNWGKEHSFEYAWGQCLFPEDDAMVEGFTGRVRVAGRTTPRLSGLVVRRGGREYRFDRLFDPWRQEASLEQDRWHLRLRSGDGDVELRMDASKRPVACLGYYNPDGALSYCLNSKLAEVELTVRPSDGAAFTCRSAHGGALEFLRREPDPRFTRVV